MGDVDLKRGELHVRQRADRYDKIGRPKSEAGERTVPLPPMVVNALREHRLACPKGELGSSSPTAQGGVEHRNNIVERGLHRRRSQPACRGSRQGKVSGPARLRHFYASWCINRRVDGGLELPLKVVQARLGHASIQMTADRYGHLFPAATTALKWRRLRRLFWAKAYPPKRERRPR